MLDTFTPVRPNGRISSAIAYVSFPLLLSGPASYGGPTATNTDGANLHYGGDGGLLKKTEPGATSLYVGGIYELRNSTATKYYSVAGETIAMRKGLSIVYLLNDHLGSNTTFVSLAGAATGTVSTDKLYTGQQQEPGDALELYHYNARVYSTLMGRFLSVDPIAGSNPQRLNPYSYVANNPLKYTDPSGMCLPDIDCPGDRGTQETELLATAVDSWADSRSIEQTRDGCDAACQMRVAADAFAAATHAALVDALKAIQLIEQASTALVAAALPLCPGPICPNDPRVTSSGPGDGDSANNGVDFLKAAGGGFEYYKGHPDELLFLALMAASRGKAKGDLQTVGQPLAPKPPMPKVSPRPPTTPLGASIESLKQSIIKGDGAWSRVSQTVEPATSASYRGGTSVLEIWRNNATGEQLRRHILYDRDGNFQTHDKYGTP
jgi:RHS repeat-associated protein